MGVMARGGAGKTGRILFQGCPLSWGTAVQPPRKVVHRCTLTETHPPKRTLAFGTDCRKVREVGQWQYGTSPTCEDLTTSQAKEEWSGPMEHRGTIHGGPLGAKEMLVCEDEQQRFMTPKVQNFGVRLHRL
jgi:hypothetical protein